MAPIPSVAASAGWRPELLILFYDSEAVAKRLGTPRAGRQATTMISTRDQNAVRPEAVNTTVSLGGSSAQLLRNEPPSDNRELREAMAMVARRRPPHKPRRYSSHASMVSCSMLTSSENSKPSSGNHVPLTSAVPETAASP